MAVIADRLEIPLALVAVLVITALVYSTGLNGGSVFDDNVNIVKNLALHVTSSSWNDWKAAVLSSPASDLSRPLAMLTFATNYYFTGLDPWPMKLTNIAIHLLNTVLVFGLLRSLLSVTANNVAHAQRRCQWAALFASACWALHPINLMAVLYIVQRMESLCRTFVLVGLWLCVAGRVGVYWTEDEEDRD
jgi:hypothetical protein